MLRFTANLSLLFTEANLIDRFKAAKQQGFKAVEIQFPYNLSAQTLRDVLEQQQLKLVLFIQYDIYHMQMMGEKPDDFITRYADKIAHIQFADCPGRGQPGTGQINFEHVFSAIEKSTYSGWVGAEYKPTGTTTKSLSWFF
jgi:hydroxypyruvate isomerase